MNKPDLRFPGALVTPGWPAAAPYSGDVPARYFGVWSRTLLQTPDTRDTSTLVRWMQLGQWHVDLRIPQEAGAALKGFCGTTRVAQVGAQEMCAWQRLVDYQPPRDSVDEGWMVFETPERVVETGIHGVYFEVWERLPGSTGCRKALAEPARADGRPSMRLFVAGDYMMQVRPSDPLGPAFEISFGRYAGGQWHIEASTIAALVGTQVTIGMQKIGDDCAEVVTDTDRSVWIVMEWTEL